MRETRASAANQGEGRRSTACPRDIVRVRAHEELADVIPGRLNKVTGVTHTETHIAFRTYTRHDLEAAFSLGLDAEV